MPLVHPRSASGRSRSTPGNASGHEPRRCPARPRDQFNRRSGTMPPTWWSAGGAWTARLENIRTAPAVHGPCETTLKGWM